MVQGLTLGVNANVMHYDKNLKYFSFGQGGYSKPTKSSTGIDPDHMVFTSSEI